MEVNINLNNQNYFTKHKRFYIALSLLAVSFSVVGGVVNLIDKATFEWFSVFYLFLMGIVLFSLGNGKAPLDLFGKAYFKINNAGIIYKMRMFDSKIVQYTWDEIDEIKIKLFEVELRIDNKWVSVNLEKLSDDNLISVKSIFHDFQANLHKREVAI